MNVVGRTYLERGRPVVVPTAWGPGGGPRTSASDGKTARLSCDRSADSAGRRRGRSMTHPDDPLGLWHTARHGHEMEQQP
jgi:hypothetical protein